MSSVSESVGNYALYPDLQGKRLLVTGSSSGIGKAVALAFASQSPGDSSAPARICITSRSTSRLKPVVTLIQSQGAEAFCVAGDLTKPDDCRRIVEYAASAMGGLDVLVNSGATFTDLGAAERGNRSDIDFQEIYNIHIGSTVAMMQAAMPHLMESRGAVVNISSAMSTLHVPGQIAYNACKAMQDAVTKNYAVAYAKDGVRVNSVNPGYTVTDLFDTLAAAHGVSRAAMEASLATKHPMGRNARPEDVASAVLFLSSQASSFITGAIVPVDGGAVLTSWLNTDVQPAVKPEDAALAIGMPSK